MRLHFVIMTVQIEGPVKRVEFAAATVSMMVLIVAFSLFPFRITLSIASAVCWLFCYCSLLIDFCCLRMIYKRITNYM